MRLIDADAEIERIKEEIKGYEERRLELKRKMEDEPENNYNDWLEKIKQCERNTSDCKKEIRVLQSYSTAYDVGEVVEQVNEIGKSYCDIFKCNKDCNDCDHGCLMRAIGEIVKGGGVE